MSLHIGQYGDVLMTSCFTALRTSVEDVLMTSVGDAPSRYIEDHMGTSIGRLLGTSSGRNFAEWVEVSFMFNVSLYIRKIVNVKKKTIDL